jgi:hypothetical protein
MDLVYRMYTGEREKPYPRLEPMFEGGIASTRRIQSGSLNVENETLSVNENNLQQSFYGRATLHFNNFVTGIFKIPMPNIVPGAIYQISQFKQNKNERTESVGFSLRLFSKNQQDGAVFLEGMRTKGNFTVARSGNGEPYQMSFLGWENRVRGQLYLMSSIGIQGGMYFEPQLFKHRMLDSPTHSGWEAGGFLEFKILRVGYLFQTDSWRKDGFLRQQESQIGFVALTL